MKKYWLISFLVYNLSVSALDVVFRYDDFRLIEDTKQQELMNVFENEGVPLCVAVIPCRNDFSYIVGNDECLDRIKTLQTKGILQIALHGCTHTGETVQGEFLSLDTLEQAFRLQRGAMFLDSILGKHVHIFIPPWNRYNQTTQNVLYNLGYNIISADIADSRWVSDLRFQYYPEGVDHPNKLLAIIEKNAHREGLVVCMFHQYDINDDFTFIDLKEVLQRVKNTKDINITTFDELFENDSSFNGERIRTNLKHPLLSKILLTRPLLLTIAEAKKIARLDLFLHAVIFLFVIVIGAIIIKSISKVYVGIMNIWFILSLLMVWNQWVMPKFALIIAILTGICIVSIFILTKITNTPKLKHSH